MQTNKLPKLTPKQQEIITLLFRFRFLNRTQIQKLLEHKDHRLINSWLKELTEKGFTRRIYKSTYPENTKPAIYYLDNNGIGFLRGREGCDPASLKNLYNEKLRTNTFIDRCLLLADIYLDLMSKETEKLKFKMNVASDYQSLPTSDQLKELNPAGYLVQMKSGKRKDFIIEILADLPVIRLRQRIKRYLSLYQGGEWEAGANKDFPIVLIICPNYRGLDYVRNYAKRALAALDETELEIQLTIFDKVKESGITGDIWKEV